MEVIISQYSEADLATFKAVVEKALAKSETRLKEYIASKEAPEEYIGEFFDSNDVELLQLLTARQLENIGELKNALKRIENKTYGVCVITGQLIDKKRLLAMPTTLKSITARAVRK